MFDIFQPKRKRKSISSGTKLHLLRAQDNKCGECDKKFRATDRPHLHHRNGNPSDRNITNLIYLCSECHKRHTKRQVKNRAKKKRKDKSFLDSNFEPKLPNYNSKWF